MSNNTITEIVEFKFNTDLPDEECIRIIDSVERNFHSRQKGFIDTELAKGSNGKWVMIQHWATKKDFMAIARLMMKDPTTEEFRQDIDPKSVKMQCLEQIQLWNIN